MTAAVGSMAGKDDIGGKIARLLFQTGAIHISLQQPFILAAGWASPLYVDCRLLVGDWQVRRVVTELAAAAIASRFPADTFDSIAGAETAGIPFATLLAEKMDLPLRYVRKRPLGIGRHAQVEGGAVEGSRILLIDDLTTDGSSKLAFARGLRSAGALLEHVLTIFYNDAFPGAVERLKEAGLELHWLSSWAEVLRSAELPAADRSAIERFMADPIAWSARHGGRGARLSRG
ncbi:MAG: orotate phosphoribosyltransferase [Xanthobacteraceae bacterium]|jgi:orotate phosphoribosyltransferase